MTILFVLSLLALAAPAHANSYVRLKEPVFGCAEKADMEKLTHLIKDLPSGSFKNEAVRAYADAHCIELTPGTFRIDRGDRTFVCLHRTPFPCLWVPSELTGAPLFDDGVF
jgi:hypothetical protein